MYLNILIIFNLIIERFYLLMLLCLFVFVEIEYIKEKELKKILKILSNKSGKCCFLEDLKEDGMILQFKEFCSMFEIFLSVFGEELDMVCQKIEKVLVFYFL